MASQLFEAPSHEAHYSSPEAHYGAPEAHEFEGEFEAPESHEFEGEFESPEAHEFEWEVAAHETSGYANPEFEFEYESHESGYANPEYEYEYEGEYFLGSLKKIAGRVGKAVAPLAKKFAPQLASTLVGMIPGVGGLLAPVAGKLVGQLVREAEAEAAAMEAQFFGSGEGEFEVANTEAAHEAALAEVLTAQAAESSSEAEAEALVATALPLSVSIVVGGRRATRPVMPVVLQATRTIVRALRAAGGDSRQFLRLMAPILRRTTIALRNAQRQGQPVTGALATKVMSTVAGRMLSNPPAVAKAIANNIQTRGTVAPAHKHPAGMATCASCVGHGRAAAAASSAVRSNGTAPRAGGPRPAAPRPPAPPHRPVYAR
jgi:hypothetical protein